MLLPLVHRTFNNTLGYPGEGPTAAAPMECDEALPFEEEERLLQRELRVLSAIPGVSKVSQSAYTG